MHRVDEKATISLREFIKEVCSEIGEAELADSWHVRALCEQLEAMKASMSSVIVKTCKKHGELTIEGIYPSSLISKNNGKTYLRCAECIRAGHRRYHHKHKERINYARRRNRQIEAVFGG